MFLLTYCVSNGLVVQRVESVVRPVGLVLRPSGLVCLWFCVSADFFISPRSGGAFAFGVVGVCGH